MYRNAFTMKLKPGFEAEYKKRHDEIWPELSALLSKSGIHEYSIFLEEDSLTLFAFQKLKEGFDGTAVSNDPIVQKWWAYMADIMETNEDHSPVTKTLSEVFYMD
ncbi:L-rhamnose mutarotase [uncultured Kriegella sp.]|uniref:L-rhamnose mutarotase n=1 Tax=uncultured Kriegella sp. TaxID=1798910 RepID=UPI0030DA962D|tara:strand:- start:143731 stop:144045 length:315 start_codon:yes stop_codon:yes gene_type:complete